MAYPDTAGAFLKSKTQRLALIIVGLAAAAPAASADVILTQEYASFNTDGINYGTISNETAEFDHLPEVTGFTGYKYWGTSTLDAFPDLVYGANFQLAAFGYPAAGFDVFAADSILVTYSFTVSNSGNFPVEWSVATEMDYEELDYTAGAFGYVSDVLPTGNGTVSGSFTIHGLGGKRLVAWSAGIGLHTENHADGYQLTLDIPSNSLDVAGDPDAVPEPVTWLLTATGLAILACVRRRKTARS